MVTGLTRDIYEILGITPDAGSTLAREMYWVKVAEHLEADQRGDPDARHAIDELNAALAIVLDQSLRSEYDAQRTFELLTPTKPLPEPTRARRAILAAVLVTGTAVAAVALYRTAGLQAGLSALLVGLMFLGLAAIGMRREQRRATTAFAFLHLPEDATLDDLDVAYRTRVQELLALVRYNPVALAQLEILDGAYLRASRIAMLRGELPSAEHTEPRPRSGGAVAAAWREVVATVAPLRRGARAALGPLTTALRRRAAAGPGSSPPQVERRLAAGFRASAEAVAGEVSPDDLRVPSAALPRCFLVLESAGGRRRIPVGELPVRVGSGQECDIALPAGDQVAAEHLLVWQRGSTLLLHVIDADSSCLVNDRPVSWALLEDGDLVRVGETTLRTEVER